MDTLEITVKITNVSKVGPDLWQVSFTLSSIGRDIKAIDLIKGRDEATAIAAAWKALWDRISGCLESPEWESAGKPHA